jgi:hypothetical protein
MKETETRVCRICNGNPKPKSEFYSYKQKQRSGKILHMTRTECRECQDKRTRQYHRDNRDRYILNNSRRADKLIGVKGDLTRPIIKEMIARPCNYCNIQDGKMGIDRVVNSLGHIITNCVPCCIRCNALKRDMPKEAWEFLVPHVKKAVELGLFGEWLGHTPQTNERRRK